MSRRVSIGLVLLCACGGGHVGGTGDDDDRVDAHGDGQGPDHGAHLFRDDLPWDRDVSGLDPSDESAAIIGALDDAGGWGTGDFRMDLSIDVQRADAATPRLTFVAKDEQWAIDTFDDPDRTQFYRPDCDEVPFPLPADGAVEGERGYACTDGGDCHLIVVDQDARTLFEMLNADKPGDTFFGGCVAVWDLDADYDADLLRGQGCTSADAGGFPIAAMLPTPEEVAAGEVAHALRFILPNERIRRGIYVPPGTHSTFPTQGGPDLPPYGIRFRLKDEFPEASITSPGGKVLVRALKKYGMFLADGGNLPLTIAGDRFAAVSWDSLGVDAHTLSSITVRDFEVVEYRAPTDWLADTTCHRTSP